MKVNEIPEKIYVPTAGLEMTDKLPCHIEYIRTDAFIEKAEEFLYKKLNSGEMKCGDITAFVEDFVKFMKGE